MAARPSTSRLSRSARYLAWTASGSKGTGAEPGRDMGKGYPARTDPDARVRLGGADRTGPGWTGQDGTGGNCSAPKDRPTNVLFAVITDGMENASCEWSRLQVMDSVKARTAEGWHFTFFGADQDAVQEGRGLGVDDNASLTWDKSAEGTAGAMRSVSASYRRLRRGEAQSLKYTEDERRAASGD